IPTAAGGTSLAPRAPGRQTMNVAKTLLAIVTLISATAAADPAPSDAEEQYARRFIGFDDFLIARDHGATVTRVATPYLGKYKQPGEGAAFYEAVGRADLAAKFRERRTTRNDLIVGGAVALVATVFAGAYELAPVCTGHDRVLDQSVCTSYEDRNLGLGLVIA